MRTLHRCVRSCVGRIPPRLRVATLVAALSLVGGVAYAQDEDLYCTGNAEHECHFPNGNYWSDCSENYILDGEDYLGFLAAQVCNKFNEEQ